MGRVVPHDFWYRPDVAACLADFDLPAVLAKISASPGWNQDELARILNYSRPTLNKIVNGVRPLRVDEAKLIVRSLAIPLRLLGFGGGENEVDATDRRQFLKATAIGATLTDTPDSSTMSSSVGPTDVARMREWIDTFRRMDNRWGGGHGLSQAVQYLKVEVLPVLNDAQMSNDVRMDMHSSSAQLFQLVGWMHYDTNNQEAGRKALHNAFRLADQVRDHALAAEIEAGLSHQSSFLRMSDFAEDYAASAVRRARLSGLVSIQSEVAAMEAHAYALQGDARRTVRALKQAEDLYSQIRPTEVPEWQQYYGQAYLNAKFGHVLRDLGRPNDAEQYARNSLNMSDGYERGRVFNLCLLASILVDCNKLDEAIAHAELALQMAGTMRSSRIQRYLNDVDRRLAPYANDIRVRRFRHQLAQRGIVTE